MSGGSKSPTVQTSSQSVQQVPQYVTDAQNALQGYGQSQLSPFLGSSPNYGVAGLNADQLTGFDLTRQNAQDAFSAQRPTVSSTGYTPTMVGPANGYTAQGYTAQGYTPAMSGGAATYDPRIAGNAASYDAALGTAAQTGATDYRQFLNPYTEDVIDPAVRQLRQQHDATSANIGAQAAASESFGGSSEAIRQAQNDRALGDQTSSLVGNLLSQGFGAAQGIAQGNTQLAQQSGLANQSAQNTQFQYNAQAADAMARNNAALINQAAQYNAGNIQSDRQYNANNANTAAQFGASANNTANQFGANANNTAAQFLAAAQNANDLYNAGAQNTAGQFNSSRELQAAQFNNSMLNDEQQRRMAAIQAILGIGGTQQNMLQNILGVPSQALSALQGITPTTVPMTTNTVGTQPNTAPSGIQQALGIGSTILGLGTGGGSTIGGKLLGGLFACDARLKKDIAPYGMSDAGRPLFAFRYRWEDDDAPFTIGPMAQIEEEHDPDSVVEALGIKLVRVH